MEKIMKFPIGDEGVGHDTEWSTHMLKSAIEAISRWETKTMDSGLASRLRGIEVHLRDELRILEALESQVLESKEEE